MAEQGVNGVGGRLQAVLLSMQSSTFRRSAGISCLPVKGVGPLRESEPSGSHPGCSPGGRRFESGRSPLKALHLRTVDPEQRGAISRRAAKLSSAAAAAWTAPRQRGKLAGARSRLVAVSRSEQVATAQRAERTSLPKGVVTFLLTDVEGSSRLWEADAAAMRAAISLPRRAPRACRRAPAGACARSSRARATASWWRSRAPPRRSPWRLSSSAGCGAAEWPAGCELRVRVALHSGEAQLRDAGNYFGPALNRCARLRALAHGGQTLVSRATYELVAERLPEGASLRRLGPQRLRDLGARRAGLRARPSRAALRLSAPALARRAARTTSRSQLTSFVGRERELAELAGARRQTSGC